jgi:hypothetical protein
MSSPADDTAKDAGSGTETHTTNLTRREWLLRLGEAAVVMGFSASLMESEADRSWAAALDPSALPAGLYAPSDDHLRHALSSDDEYHSIPPGSETDYVRPGTGVLQPQFFAPEEFKTVRRVVELMLGQGPGQPKPPSSHNEGEKIARAVTEWIDLRMAAAPDVRKAARRLTRDHRALAVACYGAESVAELEAHEPDKISRAGLRWLAKESQDRYR